MASMLETTKTSSEICKIALSASPSTFDSWGEGDGQHSQFVIGLASGTSSVSSGSPAQESVCSSTGSEFKTSNRPTRGCR